jgi:acetylornithine deacetylase/succinyl-diaminopimelate desuccinylase-like protein
MESPVTASTPVPAIDPTLRDLSIAYLQTLLRIDTINLPGNERAACDAIAAILDAEGIGYEIVDSAPGRASIVARLQAAHATARPVLLMGHVDVVSVERDKWERDPFGGELVDGYLWGRGALDMKSQVAGELAALVLLKRSGVALDRDIIFAAFADEEAGGAFGAEYVWTHRPDLLDAEYGINEGGGSVMQVEDARFYLCQAGEKGASRLRITTSAAPGHASVPLDDTAMTRMGEVLVKLAAWRGTMKLTEPVRLMLEGIAAADAISDATRMKIRNILDTPNPQWEQVAALPMAEMELLMLRATTHDTAVPTIIHGGQLINVIPSEVVLDVDGRLLPGSDPEAFRAEIAAWLGDLATVELTSRETGVAADPASPFFEAIEATMADLQPGIGVIPYLVSGGTDAPLLPGVKIYGFFPFLPTERMAEYDPLVHGHNERIHIDDLAFGAQFVHDLVLRFCAA